MIILRLFLFYLLPLFRRIAPGRPGMNSSNFTLQGRINKPMSRQHVLLLELRGDNNRLESLTATACEERKGNFQTPRQEPGWRKIGLANSVRKCLVCPEKGNVS